MGPFNVQHLKIIKLPSLFRMERLFLFQIHKSNIVESCTKFPFFNYILNRKQVAAWRGTCDMTTPSLPGYMHLGPGGLSDGFHWSCILSRQAGKNAWTPVVQSIRSSLGVQGRRVQRGLGTGYRGVLGRGECQWMHGYVKWKISWLTFREPGSWCKWGIQYNWEKRCTAQAIGHPWSKTLLNQ